MAKNSPLQDTQTDVGSSHVVPLSSGSPQAFTETTQMSIGKECWGAFSVGEEINKNTTIAFQLAPRLYLLKCDRSTQKTAGDVNEDVQFIADLPQHLIFQDTPSTNAEGVRQTWLSEDGAPWKWELSVARNNGTFHATLTATPAEDANNGRLTWIKNGDWAAFGSNLLDPVSGVLGTSPLIVEAP